MAIIDVAFKEWLADFKTNYPALFAGRSADTIIDALTVAYKAGAARQPVGQITDTEIDARLNALYREMVDSGQHNGGMSGVAWDRAVYRMASGSPAQAVDLGGLREMLESWKNSDYPFSYEGQCAQRALDACLSDLKGWLDSQAVGNG
ncbi:hypothetical protein I5T88_06435 [Stenotrophomonas maltophilia]|nr:hypothetical protein [Stenotrophomonas maltophilia]